jgi:hypothetical protein
MTKGTANLMNRSELDTAKERLRIPELWRILNLPGEPATRDGVKFCSPLRSDSHPSCSFSDGCKLMTDWSRGQHYDAINFLGEVLGLQNGEATKRFLEIANGHQVSPPAHPTSQPTKRVEPRPGPDLRGVKPCSESDLEQIARVRSIPLVGLRLARDRKLLFSYYRPSHGPCWLITDDARRNAIKRRLDGKPFQDRDPKTGKIEEKKSKCVFGSDANWPVGIAQAGGFPSIALCEGAPDFLAAFWLAYAGAVESLVAPVCMTGASCHIHEDALAMFRGKRVRIFGHADEAGQDTVQRWADQLWSVQAEVGGFDFSGLVKADGSPVKDLNDFLRVDHKRSGCPIEVVSGAFDFATER